MAFDPTSRKIVMFGGFANGLFLDDTWEWSGTSSSWTPSTPTVIPRRRSKHAMGVDPIRRRLVMLGGEFTMGTFSDLWDWDGVTWMDRSTSEPPPARSATG